MTITLYGTPTQGYYNTMSLIEEALTCRSVTYRMVSNHDLSTFLAEQIDSVPAMQIDDGPILSLGHNGYTAEAVENILNEYLSNQSTMNTKNIIVPVDFSDYSYASLSYAAQLGRQISAGVQALHVYKPELRPDIQDALSPEESEDMLHIMVDKVCDELQLDTIKSQQLTGFAAEVVVAHAGSQDIILMSNTGKGGNVKQFLGSVSTVIVDKVNCPVLLVPKNAKYEKIQKLAYAYDDVPSKACIDKLIAFAEDCGAVVDFVHVSQETDEDQLKSIREILAECQTQVALTATSTYNQGNVANTLANYVKEHDVQALVLSKRHHSFIDKLFHKSVFAELKDQLEVPIVVV